MGNFENMNELCRSAFRLAALFPHEDAARPIRSYRSRLLAAGFLGSRSFPLCAPLAVLHRPLTREELALVADEVRASAKRSDERGRIVADAPTRFPSDALPAYLGLPLSVSALRCLSPDAVLSICATPALVLALLGDEGRIEAALPIAPAPVGPTVFRAAYIANLVVFPAESGDPDFSFKWEIGEPRWLPGEPR
jgi:hypothetical protein